MRGPSLSATCIALVLTAASHAADTPESAEQKQQLQQVYRAAHAAGVCDIYLDLALWQPTHWAEGKSAREQFLKDKIIPNYSPTAEMQAMTGEQLEPEYRKLCDQARDLVQRALGDLRSQPVDELAEQRKQVADSIVAGRFLGQCQTVSMLYLRGEQALADAVAPFVRDEVYAKDERYRQAKFDAEGTATPEQLLAHMEEARANDDKEALYWSDCDKADAEFKKIWEQLAPQ